MTTKVTLEHLRKTAYIYIRQSSMGQVRNNRESTERQYAFAGKASALGWTPSRIEVLDGDLGKSGTSMSDRHDFKSIVANVSLGKAGAVFALEASRLARSNTDWHRLIEICGISGTLIIDEDGCYDPGDFNDGLLLGLKGTMAQAELHFIRARLQGGKLNKAQKGELRFPLPVGYVFDDLGRIVKDPDEQVRSAIELIFTAFRQSGSAYGVVQQFAEKNILFPKRSYGGAWDGKLQWGRLTDSRVLQILKNPSYAGVYAFGRFRCVKEILEDGEVRSRIARMPRDQWLVEIRDHHEGYITFDQQLKNLDIIQRNQTNPRESVLSGPVREGLAMLQGLLICSSCGRRLSPRYRGNGGIYPIYECNWRKREGLSKTSCMTVQCGHLDRAVEARVLEVINQEQIDLALEAFEVLQQREQQISGQWKLRLQRAEYEVQLAQKQYDQVDPENRLVASTLERRWNDALAEREKVQQQITELTQEQTVVSSDQRDQVLALARDLPKLWHAPETKSKDKKRILQLLLEDITVEKPERYVALLHIRWQGGVCEDLTVDLPRAAADRWRHSPSLVNKVRQLAEQFSDEEIATQLNAEELTSAKGNRFTRSSVSWIRHKHQIPPADKKEPHELTVKDVANRFGVSHNVVYYWISHEVVTARRLNQGTPYWITIDQRKSDELEKWISESSHLGSP
jgi:DNA invertase Pin-like site-specific DNA recombinase